VSFGEILLSGITWRLLFVLPEKGTFFQNCGFLWVFQMGFFAEAGPVQIFVSNHVSFFSLQCALKNCNISSLSLRMPSGEFVNSIECLQYALKI
jgi:hypothetical protein